MDDHVSKLEHMGKETVKKLQDIKGAAIQAGVDINIPENCINKGRTIHANIALTYDNPCEPVHGIVGGHATVKAWSHDCLLSDLGGSVGLMLLAQKCGLATTTCAGNSSSSSS